MNSVSKVKIAVGYTLLLGVLFFSLFFVHRGMEHLMLSDNRDVQWTDSLITLLRKKDANTIYMLRVLSETNDSMVSTREIENIIATRQDSFVTNQRVQQRINYASRHGGYQAQEERILPPFGRGVRAA